MSISSPRTSTLFHETATNRMRFSRSKKLSFTAVGKVELSPLNKVRRPGVPGARPSASSRSRAKTSRACWGGKAEGSAAGLNVAGVRVTTASARHHCFFALLSVSARIRRQRRPARFPTCGLGIRESGSPYLFIYPRNLCSFGVVRARFGAQFATECATRFLLFRFGNCVLLVPRTSRQILETMSRP